MPLQRFLKMLARVATGLLLVAASAASMATGRNVSPPAQTAGTTVVNGLMWALENNGENVNWNTANEYCENLTLAGHADWRLPTIEELETLYEPEADTEYRIRGPFQLASCCLWSSTLLAEDDDGDPRRRLDPERYAYGFYFSNGDRYYSAMGFPDGRAQCVRAP